MSTDSMHLRIKSVLAVLLVLAFLQPALADEILPIGSIWSNAPSLAQHLVTFRGTVQHLEQIPPIPTPGCPFKDRYKAIIEDDTGSIEVLVCGTPLGQQGQISKGDMVLTRAVISVINNDGFHSTILANAQYVERASKVEK